MGNWQWAIGSEEWAMGGNGQSKGILNEYKTFSIILNDLWSVGNGWQWGI